PPLSEFNMLTTELGAGEEETLKPVKGPGIMIVTKGVATMKAQGKDFELKEGAVFFIGQGVETSYEAKEGLQMFTAYVE
ncbi:hypothetical protein LTR16_009859, partial [Cryomyces antarcticus]